MAASLSQIMNNAWNIARAAAAQFGGKAREYFRLALVEAWAAAKSAPRDISVTYQNGNKEVVATLRGVTRWEGGHHVRDYFKIIHSSRAHFEIYEVIKGSVTGMFFDELVIGGRIFGYDVSCSGTSRAKRVAALNAIKEMIRAYIG